MPNHFGLYYFEISNSYSITSYFKLLAMPNILVLTFLTLIIMVGPIIPPRLEVPSIITNDR